MPKWNKEMRSVFASAFVAALIASSGVALVTTLVITDYRAANALRNTRTQCTRSKLRDAIYAEFIRSDGDLRAKQQALNTTVEGKTVLSKLGPALTVAKLLGESQAIETNTLAYWDGDKPYQRSGLLPRLRALDAEDCYAVFS